MSSERFEAQQVWQGVLTFTEVGIGGTLAVAYRSPDSASGRFTEFWAMKSGFRLSPQAVGVPGALVSLRTGTTHPSQMSGPTDGAGFKVFAATQISGTLDFFRHEGEGY
jgi:hypothetical protein